MTISWWEYEELREHLLSRSDIWVCDDENPDAFGRVAGGEICLLLEATKRNGLVDLQTTPVIWALEESERYVLALVRHWTSFYRREALEELLRVEYPELRDIGQAAMRISALELEEPPADARAPATQEALPAADRPTLPEIIKLPLSSDIGTWHLNGGGSVKLTISGSTFRCEISIPNASRYAGFGPALQGWVRPVNGHVLLTAARLAGWDYLDPDASPAEAITQQELGLEEREDHETNSLESELGEEL